MSNDNKAVTPSTGPRVTAWIEPIPTPTSAAPIAAFNGATRHRVDRVSASSVSLFFAFCLQRGHASPRGSRRGKLGRAEGDAHTFNGATRHRVDRGEHGPLGFERVRCLQRGHASPRGSSGDSTSAIAHTYALQRGHASPRGSRTACFASEAPVVFLQRGHASPRGSSSATRLLIAS